jgi:NAD(P)-dependent dehydrogenase (short-subunit alcohol dehydrogenase family)
MSSNYKESSFMARVDHPEVVVVTGASAGLGRAIARAFARRGARLGLIARGRAGLDGARGEAESLGARAMALPTDVSDPDQIEKAAEAVEREFGPIGVWVNNAMISVFSPVKEMTAEEYRRVTEVTYLGFVYGSLAALRWMLPRDEGIIVQVGSALAYRSIPLQSAYCAAKHAVAGFTDSLRCELLHDHSHVKVTMVQMPAMNTRQFDWVKNRLPRRPQPVPPIYQPEVAAEVVYRAAHQYRREWLVGAPTVVAVEGNKFAPGFGDWYLAQQGYNAQQHDGLDAPDRPNNLDQPLDDEQDWGTHGDFDRRSYSFSQQVWFDANRSWLGVAGAALAGGVYNLLSGRKFWRGGILGGTLAVLAELGLSALPWRHHTVYLPEHPTGQEPAAGVTARRL